MAAIVMVGVLAGCPAGAAAAGKIVAKVNGRHVTWRGRLVVLSFGQGFSAIGTKPFARKTISLTCPVVASMVQFHVPCAFSLGLYAQGKPLHQNHWASTGGNFEVTIDAFDGHIVQGSFSGTMPAVPFQGDGTTITVEGTFRGPVRK